MIKTVVIFSGYHLPHLGGIERYTDNLSKELQKMGIRVIIVTSNHANLKRKETNNGITILRLPIYNMFKNRYPIPKNNKIFKKLIHELNKFKIDAIIVNTRFHLTSLIGAKYGKKNNIPVFLIEHGSEHLTVDSKVLDYFGEIYEHFLTRYIKRYIHQYYGVSKEACKWQEHFNIKSNGVWYNSIHQFDENYKPSKSKDEVIILYAGRILKQKGISELLNAFQKCKEKLKNIQLYIAGDGNQLEELKEIYKDEKIHFTGQLDFKDLVKLYSKANIFVYAPKWPEGLPTSILEAGLMKCAVIASPYGGTKEIIKNNYNGIMISTEDQLTRALVTLITDKQLRETLGNKLYNTVNEKFLWKNTSEIILKNMEEYIDETNKE